MKAAAPKNAFARMMLIPSTYHITNHTQGERRDGRSGLGRNGLCEYVN